MYPDNVAEQKQWIDAITKAINKVKNPGGTTTASTSVSSPSPAVEKKEVKTPLPAGSSSVGQGARARLDAGKNTIHWLSNEESKVLEFWQIWSDSIPTHDEIDDSGPIIFEVAIAADMEKLTWRTSGPQQIFIQKMVDFFWNVGAPESEIDRLNDVGALINPIQIGSWIDMSARGGMDGGWFFPVDVPMKFALEASDVGDPVTKVGEWTEKNGVTRCYSVGRDMGAAPPRQTEIRFLLPGNSFDDQLNKAIAAFGNFGFPELPEEALNLIKMAKTPELSLSVITSAEGFVRAGLLIPKPDKGVVEQACNVSGAPNVERLFSFEQSLGVPGPEYVEFQYLMPGFGYGVYKEGFDIVFHYTVGEERR